MNALDQQEPITDSKHQYGAFVALFPNETAADAQSFLDEQYRRTTVHLESIGLKPIGTLQWIYHPAKDEVYFGLDGKPMATYGWKQSFI